MHVFWAGRDHLPAQNFYVVISIRIRVAGGKITFYIERQKIIIQESSDASNQKPDQNL
jgi:hypothetical protein